MRHERLSLRIHLSLNPENRQDELYGGLQSVRINVFHVRWGGGERSGAVFSFFFFGGNLRLLVKEELVRAQK